MPDADRQRELDLLLGRVVRVEEPPPFQDESGGVVLHYEDGRKVSVEGIGYDGLWRDVIVSEEE
jgi:hypothetical protein